MKVIGFDKYDVNEAGVVVNTRTGRILKIDTSAHGYPRVTLSQDGNIKRFFIHRLVAIHFISNENNLPMVNHIDGNKLNNHVSNLEWVTCKENTVHAFRTGLRANGSDHWCAKLTEDVVKNLCYWIELGYTRGEILSKDEFINVTKTQFDDIRRRRSWKHISKEFIWL